MLGDVMWGFDPWVQFDLILTESWVLSLHHNVREGIWCGVARTMGSDDSETFVVFQAWRLGGPTATFV